jgi:phosphomannomutase
VYITGTTRIKEKNMSDHLKVSISGVRGVIGYPDGLTPELIVQFSQAFGTFIKGGTVILGSDSRPTLRMVKPAVIAGLLATGCNVIDIGIVPTPTVLTMVRKMKAKAGLAITASHNPLQWNALKMIDGSGCFLGPQEAERVVGLHEKKSFALASWDKLGMLTTMDPQEVEKTYLDSILSKVDVKKIRKAKFKVAIDPVNGAGAGITERFLKQLGCSVVSINNVPNGLFGRKAEPLPENLGSLCRLVKKSGADIGFAQDPDADRLACISEQGVPLGEEYTLALAIEHILRKRKGPVVLNNATSLTGERVAEKFGCPVFRTRIGEINVTKKMIAVKAAIGGEGNGGVIYPPMNLGRDSFAGMALILEYMAEMQEPVSVLKAALPQYSIVKKSFAASSVNIGKWEKRIRSLFKGAKIDKLDGLKVHLGESWIIVRPSNTEPIVRIIAEAQDRETAEKLAAALFPGKGKP